MQLQFHPASSRRPVRTFTLGEWGERGVVGLSAIAAGIALSLFVTVPMFAARRLREETRAQAFEESRVRRVDHERAIHLALALKERALDRADLLNRVAFLYGIAPRDWPRALDPEHGILAASDPHSLAARLSLYGRALEKGYRMLSEKEAADPDIATRVPALLPVSGNIFESAALFGPRVSPWTGEEEFFPGIDIAAPAGTEVLAPGAGMVVFSGVVRRSSAGWLWRLGNVVVVSHGPAGSTVFGHLARIFVRRGQRVARGEALGTVGTTGWSLSPQLHYEYWRPIGDALRPTDPLFASLDQKLGRRPVSLEQMEGTSAPGRLEPLPGIEISAQMAAARVRAPAAPRRLRPRRRRI